MNKILQSNHFKKNYKKLQRNVKDALNEDIKEIVADPTTGQEKHGDLKGVFVYKFKFKTQLYLLAYRIIDKKIIFLEEFGSYENFYKKIKRQ